jgi:hypothetical protein
MMKRLTISMLAILTLLQAASAQYPGWQHSGSLYILTTPEGANLPATASAEGFPLLVRLDKDVFDFKQAKAKGKDIRFASNTGAPLAYQIDAWDAAAGTASIWVRIPKITGNARQELKMFWGKTDATSESNGKAVFNESNGYLSVWHMSEPVVDDAGASSSKDQGTTPTGGIVGQARHLAGKQGIAGGENITTYPSGTGPMTTEAWFRAEKANGTVLAWGKEKRPCKVMMNFLSPPHIAIQCYFADVVAKTPLSINQWYHVVHTYSDKDSRVYVNGVLDGASTPVLDIPKTSGLWIGGWYNKYNFVGDIDEVRISKVARSAAWVKLQYENQKPLQTLVGPLVQPGADFAVSAKSITVTEGKSTTVTAKAGGAQKIYWIIKRGGQESLAAVDRLTFTLDAGRVTGDVALTLQFKAVYANQVRTLEIPVTIQEDIPEPVFTLKAPAAWDGRETIEVVPQIANPQAMQAKGAGQLKCAWSASGMAVIRQVAPGKLILKRSQNSGKLTVTATVSNGGKPATQSFQIVVKEPATDAWVQQTPDKDEKPVDNQFYARDDKNEGTVYYNGTLSEAADSVFLKVYADDKLIRTESQKPTAEKSYAFSVKLKAGLIRYKVEFGTKSGNTETLRQTAANLLCGDAYLIEGQSNAEGTHFGKDDNPVTNDWLRSYGRMGRDPGNGWHTAIRVGPGNIGAVGYWGLQLASSLVASQKIPVCIINGALGGTRIDQHMPNLDNRTDAATIYGRMLQRVQQARLTHGIRGVLWHQGEADQGADGPDGGYGWETYQQYFVDLSAAWKQDMPNLKYYYLYQIWPNACSQGGTRQSDKLRDVQRLLPRLYAHMSVMSTLGIKPEGSCHYPAAGYAEMARLMIPLVERDNYGTVFDQPITAPDLKKAYYTSDKKDEIALEFDQPMAWADGLTSQFYLDGKEGKVASGAVSGNLVKLKLAATADVKTITYLVDRKWSSKNLLNGQNGIAALTFFEVPIEPARPNP